MRRSLNSGVEPQESVLLLVFYLWSAARKTLIIRGGMGFRHKKLNKAYCLYWITMSTSPFMIGLFDRVKRFKRIFISRGSNMRSFDYINHLDDSKNYHGIDAIRRQFYKINDDDYKREQLIDYCSFLIGQQSKNESVSRKLALMYLEHLDLEHELGREIHKRVSRLYLG